MLQTGLPLRGVTGPVGSVLLTLLVGTFAGAAEPEVEEGAGTEVAPLSCWWRTDRAAVHVGQHLQLTLTCAAVETDTATVEPDWDQLQSEVVDLAPFEVVAGSRSEDVVAGSRRYRQFEYTLRLTGEEFFGQDVSLPPLEVIYRIAVSQRGGSIQQGRERTYVLPPLPVKVLSLVPALADDIEDPAGYTFAASEQRRMRAAVALVIGCGLLAAGALYLCFFLAHLLRSERTRSATAPFRVPDWRVVAGSRKALRQIMDAAGSGGWTEARVGEALAVLRVLAAVAIGMPVRQQMAERGQVAEAGEWLLHRWSLRRSRVVIAASVTAAQLRQSPPSAGRFASEQSIDDLAAALAVCSGVHYRRDGSDESSAAELGAAIKGALSATRELVLAALLPPRLRAIAVSRALPGAS